MNVQHDQNSKNNIIEKKMMKFLMFIKHFKFRQLNSSKTKILSLTWFEPQKDTRLKKYRHDSK